MKNAKIAAWDGFFNLKDLFVTYMYIKHMNKTYMYKIARSFGQAPSAFLKPNKADGACPKH